MCGLIKAKFLNKVVETLHGVVCYPYNASPLNLELFQLLLPCTWNTKERLHRDTAWSHFHCRRALIHSVPSRAPILAAYIKNRMTHECVSGKQLHIPCHPEELAASQNKKCPQIWSMRRTIATFERGLHWKPVKLYPSREGHATRDNNRWRHSRNFSFVSGF